MTDQLLWERDGKDWPNRASSVFVQSQHLRWHVQKSGAGPSMLLVHGTGASTHSWRDLLPLLAERYEVTAIDLPGHGFTSGHRDQDLTLPGMSAALAALLTDIDLVPDYGVGHSAGAAILIHMSLANELKPQRLVSINGALLPFPGVAGAVFPALAKLIYLNPFAPRFFAWRADDRRSIERLISGMGSNLDDRGIEFYARLFRSVSHVRATTRMMAQWDLDMLARRLPTLDTPLHLFAAGNDSAVPAERSFEVRDLAKHATVDVIQGLGHLAHEEDPLRFARLIGAILDQHQTGPAPERATTSNIQDSKS